MLFIFFSYPLFLLLWYSSLQKCSYNANHGLLVGLADWPFFFLFPLISISYSSMNKPQIFFFLMHENQGFCCKRSIWLVGSVNGQWLLLLLYIKWIYCGHFHTLLKREKILVEQLRPQYFLFSGQAVDYACILSFSLIHVISGMPFTHFLHHYYNSYLFHVFFLPSCHTPVSLPPLPSCGCSKQGSKGNRSLLQPPLRTPYRKRWNEMHLSVSLCLF